MLDQFEDEEKNKEYRKLFPEYFNLATVPFYWGDLEPEEGKPRYAADSPNIYRRPSPDLCVDYCRENGIDPKLHCLFYDKFIPDWTPKTDAEKMKSLYEKRFSEIAERYGNGKMYNIEVMNEVLQMHWWNIPLTDAEVKVLRQTASTLWWVNVTMPA
jgi:GH35 family endo-1,4-beta-xylanase